MYKSPNPSSILPTASSSSSPKNGNPNSFRSTHPLAKIAKSRIVRTAFLAYVGFCALFTMKHIFLYQTQPEPIEYDHFELKRTYDADAPYSVVSNLSTGVILSKMFSFNTPDITDNIQPFFIRSKSKPAAEDITLVTFVLQDEYSELTNLVKHFSGPISAVLHIEHPSNAPGAANPIKRLQTLIAGNADLQRQLDVHLITTPQSHRQSVILQQSNLHRNLARFFARSDYVFMLDSDGSLPATDVAKSLAVNSQWMDKLRSGNVFVLPGFNSSGQDISAIPPTNKDTLLKQVVDGQMVLSEKTWKKAIRNVDYNKWATQTVLSAIQNYDPYFAPSVVMRRDKMLWCPERFGNNQAACLFELYLSGADFWVLPNDFTVNMGTRHELEITEREKTITTRLYQKFHEESCLKHARAFYAAGEWDSERARHCRISCQKVLAVWGLVIRQA